MAKTCPDCHAPVEDDAPVCLSCGYPFQAAGQQPTPAAPEGAPASTTHAPGTCRACAEVNPPGELFCRSCGTQLWSGAPAGELPPGWQPPGFPAGRMSQLAARPTATSNYRGWGYLVVNYNGAIIGLPAGKAEVIIGRKDPAQGFTPDIDLGPYNGETAGVSRRHARLTLQEGRVWIEDLDSANATFVNQQKLYPGQPHPVEPGDQLMLAWLAIAYLV